MSDLPPAADIAEAALTLPPFPILFGLALQSWPGVCSFLEGMARRNGMKKSARIGLAAALLLGGATFALAQIGPPTGGYPPARLHPNLYYGYYQLLLRPALLRAVLLFGAPQFSRRLSGRSSLPLLGLVLLVVVAS
jgi:hypothetical protein